MVIVALKVIAILGLPYIAFKAGVKIMGKLSDRQYLTDLLKRSVAPADQKGLNERLRYDVAAVNRHWGAFDTRAREAELRFLKLDLIFPLVYGGALVASLAMAIALGGWPFSPWVIAPVAVTVLADWTENLVQMTQLGRYVTGSETSIDAGWIRVASVATCLKLVFFFGSAGLLVVLVVVAIA